MESGGDISTIARGMSSSMFSDKSDKNIKNLNRGVQKMFQTSLPTLRLDCLRALHRSQG